MDMIDVVLLLTFVTREQQLGFLPADNPLRFYRVVSLETLLRQAGSIWYIFCIVPILSTTLTGSLPEKGQTVSISPFLILCLGFPIVRCKTLVYNPGPRTTTLRATTFLRGSRFDKRLYQARGKDGKMCSTKTGSWYPHYCIVQVDRNI
jgi:hypothetical protein